MEHGDPIGGRIHINKFLFTNLAIYLQQKLSHAQSARRVCDDCRRTVFHRRRTYAYVQIPSWHRREPWPSRRLLSHCPAIQTHGPKLPCHRACRRQVILIRINLLPTEGTDGKKPLGLLEKLRFFSGSIRLPGATGFPGEFLTKKAQVCPNSKLVLHVTGMF